VFGHVDFRRRRSFAHPIPIGKEAEKMSEIIIVIFRSAKAKAAGVSTMLVRKRTYRKAKEGKKAEFGR
jgi:hypothetical protein